MRKLLLFVGVLGVLAGSLVYSQGGDGIQPAVIPKGVPVDPAGREVVGVSSKRIARGEYGVWITLQRKDGRNVSLPTRGRIKMVDGTFKTIDDVKPGDFLWSGRQR